MTALMADFVTKVAVQATRDHVTEQAMATAIRETIMEVEEGNWHVMVGRKFSVFATHEDKKFIYFYIGQMGFCVFCS